MARKPKETSHLRLRIDPIRLAKLERFAEKNGRTLTGEIIHRLDTSVQAEHERRIDGLLWRDHAVRMLLSGDERAAILDKIAFLMSGITDWKDDEEHLHRVATLIREKVLPPYLAEKGNKK